MAQIILENVNLAYPLLGAGVRKRAASNEMDSAGSVIRDDQRASRSVQALRDINLHLKDGDRLGVVGRNGSGKSTLLRVIAGIYEPGSGFVSVNGVISSLFNIGLGINMEATGYRNIELLGLIAGFSKQEIRRRTPEIEKFSGLGEYLYLPVRTYSNGMAMRLKFACATAFSPDILLMDEWLGAGDPEFKLKARKRMRKLVNEAGILVLATHSQKLIREECNKVLWMHKGIIRAIGSTDTIFEMMEASNDAPWEKIRMARKPTKRKKTS